MLYGRVAASISLAAALSACSAIDSTVDPRYDTVNRGLAKLRNEAILLNIVRASHEYPLNFAAIGKVSPGMSNIASAALPSFLVGPNPSCINTFQGAIGGAGAAACLVAPSAPARNVVFGNNTLGDQVNINYNYDISSQETQDFYNGLLTPVSLADFIIFLRQGYPRELLFWLFADSFEIGRLGYQYDPPYRYGCPVGEPKHRCFREFVELAVITGLTAEQKTLRHESNGKIEQVSFYRFCFSTALAIRGRADMDQNRLRVLLSTYMDRGSQLRPTCADPNWNPEKPDPRSSVGAPDEKKDSFIIPGETDTLQVQLGPYTFKVVTRSAFGMYQFLGKLMKQSLLGPPNPLPPDTPEDEIWPQLTTVHEDQNLLTVVKGEGADCFVHTYFNDGDYCVPEQAANTKRMFSILAQLIAMKTKAGDLAITPTVRALPAQ